MPNVSRRLFISAAAILPATIPALTWAQSADRALVEAFYAQLLNAAGAADLSSRAERILAAAWESLGTNSGPAKSRTEFVAQLGGFARLIPNLKWEIMEIVASGNRYVVRGRATGTPAGSFLGVDHTGRSFDIMSIDIHTVEAGRISRSYHIEDWVSAIRQLRAG